MKASVVVILALAAPSLAACAGFGGEASAVRPVAAAPATAPPAGTSTPAAQSTAPVAAVQAQPLPQAAPASAAPAAQPPAPASPSGGTLGGIGGPIGASLTEADREAASKAQIAALDSGQRRSWRGVHGVFGFVEPGPMSGGGCRAYSQTIYIAGRPNRGQGVACKQADGNWKTAS